MLRLHRVDPAAPGLTRRRRGRGFSYEDSRGLAVVDEAVLARISALAIPPAWRDVWICPDQRGHLQAAGTDAAGRRQYLYHPEWRDRQDIQKFRRIETFARGLPGLRAVIQRDLALDGVPRERVMAVAVRLLDRATFRIGSESYAERYGSFGLATLRKSHLRIEGDSTIVFDYVAKAGVRRVHAINDPVLVPVLERLKRRRSGGVELLAYREDGRWRDVRSNDINVYLKEAIGPEHSAKDFRTWHATVLAAVDVGVAAGRATSVTSRKQQVAATVRGVAEQLGNTPAVCRASYIDPRVFDRYREGVTIAPVLSEVLRLDDQDEIRWRLEDAVLDLLAGQARSRAA